MAEYISREELRKHLKECYEDKLFDADMRKVTFGIDVYVENMPAADVQPVAHAEWIGFTRSAFLGCDYTGEPIFRDTTVWKCSHCGRNTVVRDNFCPNCGARMRGTSDD